MSWIISPYERRIARQFFDQDRREAVAESGDLLLSLLGEMTERMTCREIGDLDPSSETACRELAFLVYRAFTVADEKLSFVEGEVLLGLVKALIGTDGPYRLELKFDKRGRRASPIADTIRFEKHRRISLWLESQVEAGVKLESAVVRACKEFGTNRSTVFVAWANRKRHRIWDASADELLPLSQWADYESENLPRRSGESE